MNKSLYLSIFVALLFIGSAIYVSDSEKNAGLPILETTLAAKFDTLSKNGNSSCSAGFTESIDMMPGNSHIQGSCCSAMNMHRYSEQVGGLKKYSDIPEVPSDPYDIDAGLAQMLLSHYEDKLTTEQQKAYDYAMEHSMEKGPCCCKCWRWYVYGGLGKLLIQQYHFSGEQVTEIWNLSDGCGGDGDHAMDHHNQEMMQ